MILFASDVPLRRLHRGVAKQKLDLFEFAATQVAEAGATATKIVRSKFSMPAHLAHRLTAYQTSLAVTPPSCRAPFFKNPSEHFPLIHAPNGGAKHPQAPCTKLAQVPFVAVRPCQTNRQ